MAHFPWESGTDAKTQTSSSWVRQYRHSRGLQNSEGTQCGFRQECIKQKEVMQCVCCKPTPCCLCKDVISSDKGWTTEVTCTIIFSPCWEFKLQTYSEGYFLPKKIAWNCNTAAQSSLRLSSCHFVSSNQLLYCSQACKLQKSNRFFIVFLYEIPVIKHKLSSMNEYSICWALQNK